MRQTQDALAVVTRKKSSSTQLISDLQIVVSYVFLLSIMERAVATHHSKQSKRWTFYFSASNSHWISDEWRPWTVAWEYSQCDGRSNSRRQNDIKTDAGTANMMTSWYCKNEPAINEAIFAGFDWQTVWNVLDVDYCWTSFWPIQVRKVTNRTHLLYEPHRVKTDKWRQCDETFVYINYRAAYILER